MPQPRELIDSVFTAGERESLEAFLDYLRDAVVRKAGGVSDEDARRRFVATDTTLGGLVKHLRWVEQDWFLEQVGQIPPEQLPRPPWTDEDPDADFRLEPNETITEVIDAYVEQCARSREVAAAHNLRETFPSNVGTHSFSLRWLYLHMIEETGRHAGHADILRELIDGTAGD